MSREREQVKGNEVTAVKTDQTNSHKRTLLLIRIVMIIMTGDVYACVTFNFSPLFRAAADRAPKIIGQLRVASRAESPLVCGWRGRRERARQQLVCVACPLTLRWFHTLRCRTHVGIQTHTCKRRQDITTDVS